jgi:hypothetical protein
MSEVKVNKISPRTACGTVTLGDSGDTFTIPSGATINNQGTAVNFGATGSASWVTTVKTTGFTAVAGEGYFCNTTSGGFSVNLPAGTAGAVVAIKDYAGTFDTGILTLVQNGSDKIGGSTVNATLTTEGIAVTLVFIDSTQGWLVTDSGLQSEVPGPLFVSATGGTITTVCTNYKVHTFTGPGTFTVCSAGNAAGSNTVDYLVIGGGGSSSQGGSCSWNGAGGGAGGYRFSNGTASGCYSAGPAPLGASAAPVTAQAYPIVVGAGGARNPGSASTGIPGLIGNDSSAIAITSTGGGAGRMAYPGTGPATQSANGGSGGGGAAPWPSRLCSSVSGGAGNTPPVSPSQGNPGGQTPNNNNSGGGGGGAGATGGDASGSNTGGNGGAGLASSITAAAVTRGGGGGGGGLSTQGAAGPGGGGIGGKNPSTAGVAGTANTGGGAGGGSGVSPSVNSINAAGGSGIVIIRYKFQ